MDSFEEAWGTICDYCRRQITDVAYKTWISRIEPVNIDFASGQAVLMVPNDFHRQTLTRCYNDLLNEAISQIFGSGIKVSFIIPEEDKDKFNKTVTDIGDIEYEFTFENFIVGSSNKFAHAASLAVATNPAGAYNPLFIYGNSGLGKTHILYAIINELSVTHPQMKSLYVKGDSFTNELIEAIKHGTTSEFREKYRKTDLLLVDDIQFIAGKDSTQEEFFHTFNSLYESKKQIVLTSDRPPKEIKTLEDRLKTRFEWGLIADIQPPDFETRMAIIKRKAELLQFDLPNDVCDYIATHLKTNIRQLEGTVKKLRANYLLQGLKPNLANTKIAISDILTSDEPAPVTVEKIIQEVARTFDVKEEDIISSKRSANISNARQVAMYVVREITQISMVEIGESFGGRNHSTVVYAIQQIEKLIKKDSSLKSSVEDIIKNIRDR